MNCLLVDDLNEMSNLIILKTQDITKLFNSLPPWEIFHVICGLLNFFFKINFFEKFFQNECQADWIQNRPDILSNLVWVQAVCKGYHETTLGGNELRVKI